MDWNEKVDRINYLRDLISHYEEHLRGKKSKGYLLNSIRELEPLIKQELFKCEQELYQLKEIDMEVIYLASR